MKLRKGERCDLEDAQDGICENCGKETKVRKIEAVDPFHRASRGWYNICYKCFGPQILWKKGGLDMKTPMRISYNELDDYLAKYFDSSD